jgi:hypothetical protein
MNPENRNSPDEHPKGTLALVAIYGLLLVLGWLAVYYLVYIPRGPLTP